MTTNPVFFDVAVDWLTLGSWEPEAYWKMAGRLRTLAGTGKAYPARWLQYSGFQNADSGWFCGQGEQRGKRHYITRVSGYHAADMWDSGLFRFDGIDMWYATRLDIQRTISKPDWWLPRNLYDQFRTDDGRTASIVQSDTGSTLYVGSRQSDIFIRMYEKLLDTVFLRLEFEIKGKQARSLWVALLENELSLQQAFSRLLNTRIEQRFIVDSFDYGHGEPAVKWSRAEREHSAQKALEWIASICPALQRHCNDHDIGPTVRTLLERVLEQPF